MNTLMGDRIKELRRKLGLTQDDLATRLNERFGLNINKSMISKWENGKGDPYLSYAKYLAHFFGVNLDYLVGLEDDAHIGGVSTIAAHHDEEEWSDEELAEIEKFKEFVRSKRGSYYEEAQRIVEDIKDVNGVDPLEGMVFDEPSKEKGILLRKKMSEEV